MEVRESRESIGRRIVDIAMAAVMIIAVLLCSMVQRLDRRLERRKHETLMNVLS